MTTRRLYYDDAYMREFDARVVSCEPVPDAPQQPAWGVVLDSTAFYPTSGGQVHDTGKLGEARVLDVRDRDDEILHVIDREIAAGAVHGCVDWTRRFDHMQQHTGQHLLSAMFQERFGRQTVSVHFGDDTSTLDLRGPEPTEEILEGAERAANKIIFEDRPVSVQYGTAEDLAKLGVRKEVDREGILRAIEIEGADLTPCGGTHVSGTAQIGTLLVRRTSKVRQDWRVEFVCGERAERMARRDFRSLRLAAERLSSPLEEVAAAVERAVSERDAQFKSAKALLQRLAESDAALMLQATPVGPDGMRVIARVYGEEAQPEYLNNLAAQLAKSEKTVVIFARSACGHLILAQHPGVGKDMNALLKQVLQEVGGKGGGSKDSARGKLSEPGKAAKAVELAKGAL